MKNIRWDESKNEWLKRNRGLGFEQIAVLLEQGQVLDVMDHHDQKKYPNQKMAIVEIDGYACLVPYVDDEDGVFLKTIIPSRKATKKLFEETKMKKQTMDSEERGILESYARNEWHPMKNRSAEIAKLRHYARNTLQKNKRINIRLAEKDLAGIQARAIEEGMPYQTLISSILHKYLSGRLTERKTA